MTTTMHTIQDFLSAKKIAVAGVSRNNKKFGYLVYQSLLDKGYEVFPINPHTDKLEGEKCYRTVSDLPTEVKHVLIVTPKSTTKEIVDKAIEKGITHLWIQQGSETQEAIELADKNGIDTVTKHCIHMFVSPVSGIHKFHGNLLKWFGKYPK